LIRQLFLAVLLVAVITITACDGDNNNVGHNSGTTTATLTGTVSTDKPLAVAEVAIRSLNGNTYNVPINEDGTYAFDAPLQDNRYLLRVDLGNDDFLYAVSHFDSSTTNIQNIHSYSDLVARTWFTDLNLQVKSVFSGNGGFDVLPSAEPLNALEANVQAIVSEVMLKYALSDISLFNSQFLANGTGMDRFLTENPVFIDNRTATIIFNDPITNLQTVAVDRVPLLTTFGVVDELAPETPEQLRALAIGLTEVLVVWSGAKDNIGIARYEVTRGTEVIAVTPYPFYRDTSLPDESSIDYTVVAIDEAGNRSATTVPATANLTTELDEQAPAVPPQPSPANNGTTIDVYWTYDNYDDLARFEVTRTGGDEIITRLTTSPLLEDLRVNSGTVYCYEITAVDAYNTRSEPSPSACITNSGNIIDVETDETPITTLSMAQESMSGREGETITAYVDRQGDTDSEVSVNYVVSPGTAYTGEDYIVTDGTLIWAPGDSIAKQIDVELLTDDVIEESETFSVVLTESSSNAVIVDTTTVVTIFDASADESGNSSAE